MVKLNVQVNGSEYTVPVDFWYTYNVWDEDMQHPQDTHCKIDIGSLVYGEKVFEGTANLHHLDQFNRAKGRKIAFSRAMQQAGLDKECRTAMWEAYKQIVRVE